KDIDTGEFVVELDRVKQNGPAGDQADIVQMKIAMAAAHKACGPAAVEQCSPARERSRAAFIEKFDAPTKAFGTMLAEQCGVLLDDRGNAGSSPACLNRLCLAVKIGNGFGEFAY